MSSEKKVTFDGIYYRIVVETVSGNLYVLVFYYIPDKNYHEIVQYELLNNGYDSKR